MCVIRVGSRFVAAAALSSALLYCNFASAEPAFQSELFARYPNAAASLPGCNACHDNPPSLNPFGQAYLANGLALDAALESLDSDGDGFTNGAELNASPATNPGDPGARPGLGAPPGPPSAPSPPATDGQALYAGNCAACHGSLASSGKLGATLARTQAAIAGNVGGMGYLSILSTPQIEAIVAALGSVSGAAPAVSSSNYTGMWWVPAESGWGITVNHQGSTIFATLYTYSEAGVPMWLVMSAGQLQADGRTFTGDLYRATGLAFNATPSVPATSANLEVVGTMSITFSGTAAASLTYTYGGIAVTKNIVQHVFGTAAASCTTTTGSRAALTNYQDLWWNPAEPGWGINITNQNDTVFATLYTYDSAGANHWMVMSAGVRQVDGSYVGDLFVTNGPAFNARPFAPIAAANLTRVGTMRLAFADGNTGTLDYTVNGVPVSKSITRFVFSSPVPSCSSPRQAAPASTDGASLYATQCAACHGPLATSGKGGATLARMQGAIAGNVGGMGYLSTLSATQLQAIVAALAPVASTPAACGSCHSIPPGSGGHATHGAGNSCGTCHGEGYGAGTVSAATHNNGIRDLLGSIGWSPSSQTCANACHGPATWSPTATLPCSSCHGIPPATGVHATHSARYPCSSCHDAGYSTTTANVVTHRNGTRDVAASVGWNAASQSCANACHGPATWSPTATLSCSSCHGNPPGTGGHARHSSGYQCGSCHGAGYSSSTVNAATHRNGIKELLASIGWSATSQSCANSCHGTGTWSPTATLACNSCHGNPPSTGRHGKHKSKSCSTCHGAGYSSSTVNAATHRNGVKELAATSIGWNATARSCANSCHGRETW